MTSNNPLGIYGRLLTILLHLQETTDGISINELARICHVQTSVIAADVQTINNSSSTGFLIDSANDDIYLEGPISDYDEPLVLNVTRELDLLFLQLTEFERLFLDTFMKNELAVLQRFLPTEILIKNALNYTDSRNLEKLEAVNRAINQKKVLEFNYRENGRTVRLRALPLHIIKTISDSSSCFMGVMDGGIRYFRLKDMSIPHIVSAAKIPVPKVQLESEMNFLPFRWGLKKLEEEPFAFEMYIYNEADLPHRLQAEVKDRKFGQFEFLPNSGDAIYRDIVIDSESLKTWILGYGKSVRVIKPEWLRDAIVEDVKKRISYYEEENVSE